MITVNIPATFTSHAAIYAATKVVGPETIERYGLCVPASNAFHGCHIKRRNERTGEMYPTPFVYASSKTSPPLMIGDGSDADADKWWKLCQLASRHRIPLDVLLIGRELNVSVSLWRPMQQRWMREEPKTAVALHAVQILGDLTKSQALNDRIDEIKGWFEQ